MDLIHNEVFKITVGDLQGLYRVVLNEPATEQLIVVRLDSSPGAIESKGGRRKIDSPLKKQKKPPQPLVGKLQWLQNSELEILYKKLDLLKIEIEIDPVFFRTPSSPRDQETFEHRKVSMEKFFDLCYLKESIQIHSGLSGMVNDAMIKGGMSRSAIYKLWSVLCRFGITESSLRPLREKCGAPGVTRPCDPGGRQKAGRKTHGERVSAITGKTPPPQQPGMNTAWRELIMAADQAIPTPKPLMPIRCANILNSHFSRRYKYINDELVISTSVPSKKNNNPHEEPHTLQQGEYPNPAQIRRVLEVDYPKLVRLTQKTTLGHFKRNMRGLNFKNWKGVAGPGHTWAIDSTIGDIYLRSSVNPAWIIGRPIVYIIVDVWSTAIVGFYVCLHGPSWDMAKLALFSSAADPKLIADLWGYQPLLTLSPSPTMAAVLMCDRGEYLSRRAKQTGMDLVMMESYAPPYRPDLKGLVEVIHRIMKDEQFQTFIPGAIDARRKEMELRKFHAHDGVFTVRQFVHYLQIIFNKYNLTADRSNRLDAHMMAAGVFPSPAGLWNWGHRMGVGFRRAIPQTELINSLLLKGEASVGRSGLTFGGRQYESEIITSAQWSTHARNFGGWKIPCSHYSGSVSRIWTPNVEGQGMLELTLSDQTTASAELTFDEVADAFMYGKLKLRDIEHTKIMLAINAQQKYEELLDEAKAQTAEAVARHSGKNPTITEARTLEDASLKINKIFTDKQFEEKLSAHDEAEDAHQEMMKAILAATIESGGGAC